MTVTPLLGSDTFSLVVAGVLRLHELIRNGQDDSPEAESIRDTLDLPLRKLDRTEQARAQWLSEDLYSIGETLSADHHPSAGSIGQQQLVKAIQAWGNQEWDLALALLRQNRDYIPHAVLSYFRGTIWLAAGHPNIAAVFFRHASENHPTIVQFRVSKLLAPISESSASVRSAS